jgi:hypothetical protein
MIVSERKSKCKQSIVHFSLEDYPINLLQVESEYRNEIDFK